MSRLTKKEKQALNELVEKLKKLYGHNLSEVILYGSKARGDAKKYSDIDIMIVLKEYNEWYEEFEKIFSIVNEVCYKYEILISYVIKSEEEFLNRDTPLLLNVRKEGIPL
ncbi:MAG: nucleotidyltransferase domain-containing protein [Endomicrobia bacterium]|nr:nucleotidyltransferase domain-containing protein [Endomicrobiia bacterium]MDW8056529.1 nucleotidyltransferase domain-containing protein [Elusimicrobiota bacterium]